MTIAWDSSLSTGHAEIDAQHRELFQRLDAFHEASRAGGSPGELTRTIVFLQDYVVHHFANEETLMVAKGYPGLADHRSEHDTFLGEVRELIGELERGGPSPALSLRVGDGLSRFLRDHIQRTDRQLVQYLHGNG